MFPYITVRCPRVLIATAVMEHRPACESKGFSRSQETTSVLHNPDVLYLVNNGQALDSKLCLSNPHKPLPSHLRSAYCSYCPVYTFAFHVFSSCGATAQLGFLYSTILDKHTYTHARARQDSSERVIRQS
jgi:hypothetical protein